MPTHTNNKLSPIAKAVRSSIVCLGLAHGVSHAALLVVTSNADNGGVGCEFREAVEAINNGANGGGCNNINPALGFGISDTIIIDPNSLAGNTVTINNSEISINNSVIIQGFDGFTLNVGAQFRALDISYATVVLTNLIISNGSDNGGGIRVDNSIVSINNSTIRDSSIADVGGGIRVDNSLITINNSTIRDNFAFPFGGGITLFNSTASINNSTISDNSSTFSGANRSLGGGLLSFDSTVTINYSTFNGNFANAGYGGGLFFEDSSSVTISNSTISGNSATRTGGGLNSNSSNITINNSTISSNSASETGGGIYSDDSIIRVSNATVSNNFAITIGGFDLKNSALSSSNTIIANSISGGDCDVTGSINIDSASIVEDGSCNTQRAIDPQLGPLADNGGATLTHALLPNSPARNTGILATCELEDQLGQVRNSGDNTCDVGAVEFTPEDDSNFFVIPLPNGKTVVIPL